LEELLAKVQARWNDVEFNVIQYKDMKDVFMLGSIEDIQVSRCLLLLGPGIFCVWAHMASASCYQAQASFSVWVCNPLHPLPLWPILSNHACLCPANIVCCSFVSTRIGFHSRLGLNFAAARAGL